VVSLLPSKYHHCHLKELTRKSCAIYEPLLSQLVVLESFCKFKTISSHRYCCCKILPTWCFTRIQHLPFIFIFLLTTLAVHAHMISGTAEGARRRAGDVDQGSTLRWRSVHGLTAARLRWELTRIDPVLIDATRSERPGAVSSPRQGRHL
jgi:hypothetical protein